MLRALRYALVSVGVVGASVLAGLWAWSGTQASLDWAWRHYAAPRGMQADGLSGSLRTGLKAQRVQAQAGDLHLDLREVALAWDPWALLDRQLRITGLRAVSLRIQRVPGPDRVPQRAPTTTLPDALSHSLSVRADHLALDRLEWTGAMPFHAGHLAAAYRYDPAAGGHQLTLLDASIASGRYHGQVNLGARAPWAIDATLRGLVQVVTAKTAPVLRLTFNARASGTLEDLVLQADLRAGAAARRGAAARADTPAGHLQARITPGRAPFVQAAQLQLQRVDLAALWPQGPRTDLQGQVRLAPQRDDGWQLHADLRNGRPGPWDLHALPFTRVQGEGEWRDGVARMRRLHAQLGDAVHNGHITGQGHWQADRSGHLDLHMVRVQAHALHSAWRAGTVRAPQAFQGRLQAQARAGLVGFELALQAQPMAPTARTAARDTQASGPALALGDLRAQGRWQSGQLSVQGHARGQVQLGGRILDFALAGEAQHGADAHAPWQGRIHQAHLVLPQSQVGAWRLELQAPVGLRAGRAARAQDRAPWTLDAGQAWLSAPTARGSPPAVVTWSPARWGRGELHCAGRIQGLPLAWWPLASPAPAGHDMVFDAQWDLHLAHTLRIQARLARVRGDVTLLAETPEGTPVRVAAGVREASLTLNSDAEAVRLALRWDSERAGTLEGELSTRLTRGGRVGWHWPAQAPISGRLQARLPRIAAWSVLAPPGWRLRGSLAADLTLGGTRGAPSLTGPLRADDVALRSVVDGIALERGRLRARWDHPHLVIDEWVWHTPGERQGTAGTLRATGQARWVDADAGQPGGVHARIDARLHQLQASVRRDRQVTLSGDVSASITPARLAVQGNLRVDRARIGVPDTPAPRLGDDVSVYSLPSGTASPWVRETTAVRRAIELDLSVDLGRDLRVRGRGVDTGVQGQVRVTGDSFAQPRLVGTVQAVNGRYTAYGQRLDLRRGVLRFTGPHDDPALDVIAVRSDLAQPVGVQITGRAQAPVLRLWSQAPATEAEKLSWLVLGRSTAAGSGETVLLEQAALSLLARRAGLGTGGLAGAFGLDTFTLRREGEQGAALTLGKRLSRRLYAAYERSLSGALGTLYVFYDLTTRLSLRAQAGDRTGVDLVYALSFDRPGDPAPTTSPPISPATVPTTRVQGGPGR